MRAAWVKGASRRYFRQARHGTIDLDELFGSMMQ
jgi:hypothetical protein